MISSRFCPDPSRHFKQLIFPLRSSLLVSLQFTPVVCSAQSRVFMGRWQRSGIQQHFERLEIKPDGLHEGWSHGGGCAMWLWKERVSLGGIKATASLGDVLDKWGRFRHGLVIKYSKQSQAGDNTLATSLRIVPRFSWSLGSEDERRTCRRRLKAILLLLYLMPLCEYP